MISKYGQGHADDDVVASEIASGVHNYALVGFLLCLIFFVAYLWYQVCPPQSLSCVPLSKPLVWRV